MLFPPPKLEKDSADDSVDSDASVGTEDEDREPLTDEDRSDAESGATSPEISDVDESPEPSSEVEEASEAEIESADSSDY